MARYVSADAGLVMGKSIFGTVSQSTVNYLQDQIHSLATAGTEFGRAIYEKSMAVFNAVNSDAANDIAEAVISQVDAMLGLDIIESLTTVTQLQNAKPIMQGYLMCHPVIRQAWYDGKIEGYSDTYVDLQPGVIGHEHDQYRFVMNGVNVPHETQSHQRSIYFDRDNDRDTMLSIRKLSNIFDSQEAALMAIEAGEEDFSSTYGASM